MSDKNGKPLHVGDVVVITAVVSVFIAPLDGQPARVALASIPNGDEVVIRPSEVEKIYPPDSDDSDAG